MTTIINAVASTGLTQTADGSGIIKVQSNGVTTNALAWVNFNGNNSPGTIRAQYNISSVTKNTTGDYTLNFTNALSDANYAFAGSASYDGTTTYPGRYVSGPNGAISTTQLRISTGYTYNVNQDCLYVQVVVFGN